MATPKPLPPIEELIPLAPLYVAYEANALTERAGLQQYMGRLSAFCRACGKESVFSNVRTRMVHPGGGSYREPEDACGWFSIGMHCQLNTDHPLVAVFYYEGSTLWKVGQYPSLADMLEPEIKPFKRVLGEERQKELLMGYRLAASGLGIGSFVYLRRIFEGLVAEAFRKAQDAGEVQPEDEFQRMDEKIQLLREHLPDVLVENRAMYGVLSLGVHELEEKDCLAYFPVMRTGIELILARKLEQVTSEEAKSSFSHALGVLKAKHAKGQAEPAKQS